VTAEAQESLAYVLFHGCCTSCCARESSSPYHRQNIEIIKSI